MKNPHDEIALFYNRLFSFPSHYDEELVDGLDQILEAKQTTCILDCGCGTGNPSIGLAKRGYDVLAIDTSKEMLSVAKQNALDVGVRLKTKIFSMTEVGHLDKIFDCAIFHDCLYYLCSVDELISFFRQVKKTLSKNGLIYIATKRWEKSTDREARQNFEFRGTIEGEDHRLIVFDIIENQSLVVFLLTEVGTDIILKQRIVFPWYPHAPSDITEALGIAGFTNARCVLVNEEEKYNCVGIVAEVS